MTGREPRRPNHVINQRGWIRGPHPSVQVGDFVKDEALLAVLVHLDFGAELVEQPRLSFQDLLLGDRQSEPGGFVDFGKLLLPAGLWRPFHGECVAVERAWVEISADGPGEHSLAAGLPDRFKRQELAFDRTAHLLFELSPRRGEWLLTLGELALWNRPRPVVFFCPERAPRMDEQYFDARWLYPEEKKSGALFRQDLTRSRSARRWRR